MFFKNFFQKSSNNSKEPSSWKVLRSKAKAAESVGNHSDAAKYYKECLAEMQATYESGSSSMSERYLIFKSSEMRFALAKVERLMEDGGSKA